MGMAEPEGVVWCEGCGWSKGHCRCKKPNQEPARLTPETLGEEDRKQLAFGGLLAATRLAKLERMERNNGYLSESKQAEKTMCRRFVDFCDRLLGESN